MHRGRDDEGAEIGPLSMTALDKLFGDKDIDGDTEVHTKDQFKWSKLSTYRCLRWRFLMTGTATLSPVQTATVCLDMMQSLCVMFPVKDSRGIIMRPLPRARKELGRMDGLGALPHIVSLFITQHPVLINKAASLVQLICEENDALLRKLYRTGLYTFAFMYQGSNMLPLIDLVKNTHTLQTFQGFQEAMCMTEDDICRQSILSTIFPDSLVLYLHHRTAQDFTRTYLGENDTPELIWTQGMRDKLMHELTQHTSDFAWQLREYPMSVYDYEVMPPVTFDNMKEEIWLQCCYLNNLTDTSRFPDWPIDDPVGLLRSLLSHWKSLLKLLHWKSVRKACRWQDPSHKLEAPPLEI